MYGPVELALHEVSPPDHDLNMAGFPGDTEKRRLCDWFLLQQEIPQSGFCIFFNSLDFNDITGFQNLARALDLDAVEGNCRIGLAGPPHGVNFYHPLLFPHTHQDFALFIIHLDDNPFRNGLRFQGMFHGFFFNFLGKILNFFFFQMLEAASIALALIQGAQSLLDLKPRDLLHFDIYCRVNLEPFFVQHIRPVFFFDIPADMFGVDGHLLYIPVAPWFDVQLCVDGFGCLHVGDKSFCNHSIQNVYLPLLCPLLVMERRIAAGGLGQTGQNCTFGQIEILGGFSKIVFCGGFNPVSPVSQVNLIQIQIKDFSLGKGFVDAISQNRFFNLTPIASFGCQQK